MTQDGETFGHSDATAVAPTSAKSKLSQLVQRKREEAKRAVSGGLPEVESGVSTTAESLRKQLQQQESARLSRVVPIDPNEPPQAKRRRNAAGSAGSSKTGVGGAARCRPGSVAAVPIMQVRRPIFPIAKQPCQENVGRRRELVDALKTQVEEREASVAACHDVDLAEAAALLNAPMMSFDWQQKAAWDESDDDEEGLEVDMPKHAHNSGESAAARRGFMQQEIQRTISQARARSLVVPD